MSPSPPSCDIFKGGRVTEVLYTHIDQTLVNSLHGLLNCEIGGLDCHVITTEYRTRVQCIHMQHLFCNALVHVIYSVVLGQYSNTITLIKAYDVDLFFTLHVGVSCSKLVSTFNYLFYV